jgi:hypothetical protein
MEADYNFVLGLILIAVAIGMVILSRPHDGVSPRFMQIRIVGHTWAGAALTIFVIGVVWAVIYRPW